MSDARGQSAEAGEPSTQPFLECRDLHAYYGESYIVQGVSFDVAESEVVALLGRNGAGKTSILQTIARAPQPALHSGTIHLAGKPLHSLKDYQAARSGVALVPEDRRIIPGLSVEENLTVAQIAPGLGWPRERIFEYFPRLAERRRQEATTLSGGEQQMLAVARALARDVRMLLLDEPYEGLAPKIVQAIEEIVAEIKRLGITTIIVEQNALAALELANQAIIIDMGQVVFTGSAREVLDNRELRDQYLAI